MEPILPIPTHLKNILIPKGTKNDEFSVFGEIICDCGNKIFIISYIGDYDRNIVTLCEYEGVYYLAIKCKCSKCDKLHLIFDDNMHGWNGFVCRNENAFKGYKNFPIKQYEKIWSCPKCSNELHEVSITIFSQGKEDFISELLESRDEDTRFTEGDWVNAFSWITIITKCTKCGFEDKEWIDYETM
jgi:hypothetical protein